MFLLGLLSIIQMVFLPGYLVLRLMKLDARWCRTAVLTFALSLIVNHFLVLGLVLIGAYQSNVLYAIFAVECLFFVRLSRWMSAPTIGQMAHQCDVRLDVIRESLSKAVMDSRSMMRLLVFGLGCAFVAIYAVSGLAQMGEIFSAGDAVNSWNRWAMSWATNQFPNRTWEYPQLLPTNWSITYLFIQDTSVWFFAKATMPLFCLLLLLAMLDLYRETKNPGYILGMVLTYILLMRTNSHRMLDRGMAEVPLAFFAFTAVYLLVVARNVESRSLRSKYLALGAVLSAGAALTKQGGLFIACLYPALMWVLVLRRASLEEMISKEGHRLRIIMQAVGLIAVLIGPWYLYNQLQIQEGQDFSNIGFLTETIHEGRNLLGRFNHAFDLLLPVLKPVGIGFLLLTVPFSLFDPVHRWLTALVVVPYFLIWTFGFSYDTRNLALCLPFLGMSAGVGFVQTCRLVVSMMSRLQPQLWRSIPDVRNVNVAVCFVLLVIPLVVLNFRLSRDVLKSHQQELQATIGTPVINQRLYSMAEVEGIDGDIITDYQFLNWLPHLNRHYRLEWSTNLSVWRKSFEDPAVRISLVNTWNTDPEIWSYLASEAALGRCELLFETSEYRCYRKVGKSSAKHRLSARPSAQVPR